MHHRRVSVCPQCSHARNSWAVTYIDVLLRPRRQPEEEHGGREGERAEIRQLPVERDAALAGRKDLLAEQPAARLVHFRPPRGAASARCARAVEPACERTDHAPLSHDANVRSDRIPILLAGGLILAMRGW